jgi:mechanosensitive ion channel-like protein
MEPSMKSRQWLITVGLLVLVLAAVVGSVMTRDSAAPVASLHLQTSTEQAPLVDERPLQTARALKKLASGEDERKVADQAEQFADDEVDRAFHDALRDATHVTIPKDNEFFTSVNQAESQVADDKDRVAELKKQADAASGARQAALQNQLDLAQAQLELDSDELNDAKEDLIQSGADPGSLIQRQFDQHQAAEHVTDEKSSQATASSAEANYQAGSLMAQFATWRALRSKALKLQPARDEAVRATDKLSQQHRALHAKLEAGKAKGPASAPPAGQTSANPPGATATPEESAKSAITSLHRLSDDQKNLADLDKRIQDERGLQNSYATWIGLIQSHQRAALHGMIQSGLWILLIILGVNLLDGAIDRYLADPGLERTRLHTLRVVIHSTVQAVGVLLILLVIFGAPSQIGTILGLAGAGLTVALKDFIVAFFGWFVLMGKNGLRVGDWVEINEVAGEVVEINLLRTVLLETGNWTDTGHPTGRKVAFVNSYAIEGHFFNFTTSGQWLWDELEITVPPNQDPYPLLESIQKTVAQETATSAHEAEEEWQNATTRYKVRSVSAEPTVNLRPTAAGVEINVRYIARAHERSAIRARLNQALVELLHHREVDKKEGVSAAK